MKKSLLILILLFCFNNVIANINNIGIPVVRIYPKDLYKAGMQNWAIIQDNNGIMYFGNNYGLLEFNGKDWNLLLQTDNKTIIRSMAIDNKGTLYLGAQNEFGYVKTNIYGQKQYVSLTNLIGKNERNFSDIWNIYAANNGVYFFSTDKVFYYSENKIYIFKPSTFFIGAFKLGDSVLVQEDNKDIITINENSVSKAFNGEDFQKRYIKSIYSYTDNSILMVTNDNILVGKGRNFKSVLPAYLAEYLHKQKIYCSLMLRNGYLVIGTVRNGILILDHNFLPVQVINSGNGLINNTILSLGTDDIGNLWVATDNGINYIEIATPLYKLDNYYNLEGSVYSILESKNKLYVGTNSGLYSSTWNNYENPLKPTLNFKLVADLSGQVWNIYEINNSIYVCHNDGTFKLSENNVTNISKVQGAWNLLKVKTGNELYIQGTYSGFVVYKMENNQLVFRNTIKGFSESCRIMKFDNYGYLWMAHGYKGIYRFKFNPNFDSIVEMKFYNRAKGFPSNVFINLFKVKNEILFGTELGVYMYDYKLDTMVESPFYKQLLGNTSHIRLLKEKSSSEIWYIKGNDMVENTGIIHLYDDGKKDIIETPFQRLRGKFIPGFENITFINSGNVLFGTGNGILIYDKDFVRNFQRPFNALISKVKGIQIDTVIYGFKETVTTTNISTDTFAVKLSSNINSLNFAYSANYYEDMENILFSCFLEGFDQTWTDWEKSREKQYTNLSYGKYRYHVKAKNVYGTESNEAVFEFEITPPFYWTFWAKVFYFIAIAISVYLLIRYAYWYISNEKKKLKIKHISELRKKHALSLYDKLLSENKLKSLSEEKLTTDLQYKSSQLASTTLNIMQMNEAFLQVKEEILNAINDFEPEQKNVFRKIIIGIDNKLKQKENWENFELHFNTIHNDFLRRLKNEYPDLNYRDIRLCAYLRLNLSSKEISNLMGISVRGIESIRYRVRRKLKLKTNDSLTDYLLHY